MRKNSVAKNWAIILMLAFLLAACTPVTTATPIPPTAALRLIPTLTQTPAYKLRLTPKPTKTPKPDPTRTSVPTYTPATLSQFDSPSAYKLREWTADQADLMIAQIASHLKAIENDPEYYGASYSSYMSKYHYLALAESEALLRFPDAPQVEAWRWDICYNLAFSNQAAESADASELPCYAKLMEDGLNSGQTNLSDLPGWFGAHESRFSFKMASQTPPPAYISSAIITLEDNAFLWLLEKDGKFQVTGLMSSMFFYRESGVKFQLIDLTDDQFPELILYFHRAYCCGSFSSQFVYDLSSGTPRQLTFANLQGTKSNVSSEYDSYITKLDSETTPGLLFQSHYGDPLRLPCDLQQYEKYTWNNNQFELVETWYGIDKPDQYEDQDLCNFAINTPASQDEMNVVVQSLRQIYGNKVPGFRQLISFRLGEYYAGLGSYEKAYHFFSDVAAASSDESNAEWVKAAKTILEHYKKADDFYRTCAKVKQCDMKNVLRLAIENIQPALFPTVGETLQKIGVQIEDSGVFDLDMDNAAEQWIVVQHPGKTGHEFWILVKGSQKITALFITEIASATPIISRFEIAYHHPTIELKTPTGKILFSLQKMDLSTQPYILLASPPWNANNAGDLAAEELSTKNNFWQESIGNAATTIFTGTAPLSVKTTLLALEQSMNHDCKTYPCDQLYYFLGLANELADDKPSAVDAYLQLWKDYPDSIYTIMARSKLEQAP